MRLIDADSLMEQVVKKKFAGATLRHQEGFNECILKVRSMIHSAKTIPTLCPWVKTSDRLPTEEDADEDGRVPVLAVGTHTGRLIKMTVHYKVVPANVDLIKYFLPIPPLPDV